MAPVVGGSPHLVTANVKWCWTQPVMSAAVSMATSLVRSVFYISTGVCVCVDA